MKLLKNMGVGFLVSFIGSLPLGYLNLVGYEIRRESGISELVYYLLGVICIEVFVIYFTLIFAERLAAKKKLIRYIELFSIFFMLLLAYLFYAGADAKGETDYLKEYADYPSFWIGISLNCVNFLQLPFWIGWNLYVINARFIDTRKSRKLFYVAGTLAGTFFGMFLFVESLGLITSGSGGFSKYVMVYVIPALFVGFAIFQSVKYYQKYHRSHSQS